MRWRGVLLGAVLLTTLALGPAPDREAPTRWALLIGISDYIHFDDVEGGDLPGAEHDARRMRDVLVTRGFVPAENVRLLLNRDATREAIEESVTGWLAERAAPGDNVIVYFAGHGSQMWDEDGDELDGLDETLAPADVLPDRTDMDISDDVFGSWLDRLPTENVVVILDSCNSGTATRDVTPFSRSRLLGRDLSDIPRPPGARTRSVGTEADPSGFDGGRRAVLEIAAAQADQAAVEVFFPAEDGAEAFHGGAFTTHLVRELWRAPVGATYEEVFHRTSEAMKRNRFQQDPRLSEEVELKGSPVFHVEGAERGATAGLPVLRVDGTRVELGGGVALGITPGSVFESDGGARLVATGSTERFVLADAVSGRPDVGETVRLVSYVYPRQPLLVSVASVDTELATALDAALTDEDGIELVDDPDGFSHLLLRRAGTAVRVVGADGFVRHDDLPAAAANVGELEDVLRQEAASKRLGDMENPGQRFDVTVEMAGGRAIFGLGESIDFRVRSERAGYLTLVDLGTDGTVAVLIPNAETPSLSVPAGLELVYPDEEGVYFEALPPAGGGLVRAFVTSAPVEIEIPEGETYAYGDAAFAASVREAVEEAAGRDGRGVLLESWGSASLVYRIRN